VIKMEKENFLKHLNEDENLEWEEGKLDGKEGLFVRNKQLDTVTHFTEEAIKKHNMDFLTLETHHGKNIERITRVTGFFSKTSSWNKGKIAELNDRFRSKEFFR